MWRIIVGDKDRLFQIRPRQMGKPIKQDATNGKKIMKEGVKYPVHRSIEDN